jgi:hypothetical protein
MSPLEATSFRRAEHERRLEAYRVDATDHQLLDDINERLAGDPLSIAGDDAGPDLPTILVMGVPRAGTTLLHQVIAAGLDVGFIDCIAARFWRAPVYGMRLSRHLGTTRAEFTYESTFGTPRSVFEPHEFSYFWQHWMQNDRLDPATGAQAAPGDVDWAGFRRVVGQMQREAGRPLALKGLSALGRIPELAAELPRCLFVHIERDPVDTAASLLAVRRHYYGSEEPWWSLYPAGHPELAQLDPVSQVAGQVALLRRQLRRELEEAAAPVVETTCASLCANPQEVVEAVRATARDAFGVEIARSDRVLPTLAYRRTEEPRAEAIRSALARFDGGGTC